MGYSKFFHVNAIIRQRRNLIINLKTDSGLLVTNHADKESLIWEPFKHRMGWSKFKGMLFDLQNLLHSHNGLSFSEMTNLLAQMASLMN